MAVADENAAEVRSALDSGSVRNDEKRDRHEVDRCARDHKGVKNFVIAKGVRDWIGALEAVDDGTGNVEGTAQEHEQGG